MKFFIFYCIVLSALSVHGNQELKNSLFSCLADSPPYLAHKCYGKVGKELKRILRDNGKFKDKDLRRSSFKEKILSWWGISSFDMISKELIACYRKNKCDKVGRLECRRSAGRELERFFKEKQNEKDIEYSFGDRSRSASSF